MSYLFAKLEALSYRSNIINFFYVLLTYKVYLKGKPGHVGTLDLKFERHYRESQ